MTLARRTDWDPESLYETDDTLGDRIRRLRLMCGLGQIELAERVGTVNSTISRIERGRTDPADEDLERIAQVLDCTVEFLRSGRSLVPTTKPWLRAYADAPQRTVDRQIAHATTVAEIVDVLRLRRIPDTLPAFDGELGDDAEIERFAIEVRAAAQIDEHSVVRNSIRAAERLGCVVLPMSGELGKHLGLSVRANLIPIVSVARGSLDPDKQVPGDRQRFTVAHEIGHLTLHGHLPPPQTAEEASRVEDQANVFAGAFLAPGDAIIEDLEGHGGRVTLTTLLGIKERWGIAAKALVIRFRQLGVIDNDQARSLFKQISARGWNKGEPVTVGNESAVWLTKAIEEWSTGTSSPLADAAAATGLGRSYFQSWTTWSNEHPRRDLSENLVELPADRTPRRTRRDHLPGSVTRLPARPAK